MPCNFVTTNASCKNALPAQQEVIENKSLDEQQFTQETIDLIHRQLKDGKEGRLFAVIHVAGKQFKVTAEDIILINAHWPPQPSDEILFEKVLLAGAKDFTLIGRPLLPSGLVTVKGTVIDKDLSHLITRFIKRRRKQYQRIKFNKSELTMVRINEIKVAGKVDEPGESQAIGRMKP